MKKYYLKTGRREIGPYMLDDLKYQRISPDTLVKIDDGTWAPISHHKDLSFLLDLTSSNNTAAKATSQTTARGSFQQGEEQAARAKARIAVVVAIAVALMAAGMAFSIFMANSN